MCRKPKWPFPSGFRASGLRSRNRTHNIPNYSDWPYLYVMTRQIVEYHASIERIVHRKPSDCVIEKTNQSFQSSRTYDRLSLCLRRRSVWRNTRTSGPSLDSCESVRESHFAYLLFVVGRFSYGIVMSRLLIFRSNIICIQSTERQWPYTIFIYI